MTDDTFTPQIFDYVECPIFVLKPDADGAPVYAWLNTKGREKSGLTIDKVINKRVNEIFPGRMGNLALERQSEVFRTGAPVSYDAALPMSTGTIWLRTTIQPVRDASGHVTHAVGTSVDVTAERDEREREAMSRTLAVEMEHFVSMAAHDLRSPIANVQSLANLLREDFVDLGDGKLALIDMLEDVSKAALTLIGDVLAHASATNAEEKVDKFDLADLCENILVTLDPLRRHDAFLDQVPVLADYTAMQVVIRNLLDNSIKHAGDRSLMLEVGAASTDGGMVAVTVRDNGKGFDSPETVFTTDGKTRIESGFGLIGARRLVNSRGGTIEAMPGPDGRGAQVTFTLPGILQRGGQHSSAALFG